MPLIIHNLVTYSSTFLSLFVLHKKVVKFIQPISIRKSNSTIPIAIEMKDTVVKSTQILGNDTFFQFIFRKIMGAQSLQSCPTLCDSMDRSPPGSSVRGVLQARTLEGAAIPSSMGPSHISWVSCIAGRFLTTEPPGEPF